MSEPLIASGYGSFARDVCKALGLDRVRRLVLTIDVKEAVTVEVERFIREDEMQEFRLVCERYEVMLVRPKPPEVTPVPGEDS